MKILIPPIKNLLAAPFASQKNTKTRKKQQQFGFQKQKTLSEHQECIVFSHPPCGVVFHNTKKCRSWGPPWNPPWNRPSIPPSIPPWVPPCVLELLSRLRNFSKRKKNIPKRSQRSRSQVSQFQSPESWSCFLKGEKKLPGKHLGNTINNKYVAIILCISACKLITYDLIPGNSAADLSWMVSSRDPFAGES